MPHGEASHQDLPGEVERNPDESMLPGARSHAIPDGPDLTPQPPLRRLAFSATLHCLTGCAIGEVLGLVVATGHTRQIYDLVTASKGATIHTRRDPRAE